MPTERPLMFVGDTRSKKLLAFLKKRGWGRMFASERNPRPYPSEPWAFDNGAFVCWRRGVAFDEPRFLRRLNFSLENNHPPVLAVVPDIVAGGMESLRYSLQWLPRLPAHYPWYLAIQDGMDPEAVREVLPQFAGLFLGGSDAFKGTADSWVRMARDAGKKFHYGRAGTVVRLQHSLRIGADSIDSAGPLWEMKKMARFASHWEYGLWESLDDVSGE